MINTIINGDCLEVMKSIPDKSIDMILCDLPYGTTACKWDVVIPFEPLWEQYKRIIIDNGAIVLTGSEPFSSYLRISNIKDYKYDWIYVKNKATGFLDAKIKPLNNIETVSVFKGGVYNPQMKKATILYKRGFVKRKSSDCYGDEKDFTQIDTGFRFPNRLIEITNANTQNIIHPTQKPVKLFEYLIRTYTNENETVLDNCSGSGTTAVACINTNRNYICIEKDKTYFDKSVERVEKEKMKLRLPL